jgi:Flp pilus assembly protein TadG
MSRDQAQRPRGILRRLADLIRRERGGVAAIEFAFIAPVLLVLYFVTMEVSQGVDTNKKVARIASMVADLTTQQQTVVPATLDAIMEIGAAIIQPYNRTEPDIEITAIRVTDEATPRALVSWSRQLEGGATSRPFTVDTEVTIPEQLMIPNTFLIRVASRLDYRPVIAWSADGKQTLGLTSAFDQIDMTEQYYLRPRMSATIPCTGC